MEQRPPVLGACGRPPCTSFTKTKSVTNNRIGIITVVLMTILGMKTLTKTTMIILILYSYVQINLGKMFHVVMPKR